MWVDSHISSFRLICKGIYQLYYNHNLPLWSRAFRRLRRSCVSLNPPHFSICSLLCWTLTCTQAWGCRSPSSSLCRAKSCKPDSQTRFLQLRQPLRQQHKGIRCTCLGHFSILKQLFLISSYSHDGPLFVFGCRSYVSLAKYFKVLRSERPRRHFRSYWAR